MDRKTFIKTTAIAGAATMLPRYSLGNVKGSDKLKIALVGCGGRGSDALTNMFDADQNIEIIALADIVPEAFARTQTRFKAHLDKNYPGKFAEAWKVTEDTKFLGLDAIDKILQTDADVVALVTTPVFRTAHIEKCLKANKHVFAEKPVCIDATQYRKIIRELIPLANAKKLKVLCGTQMRYQSAIQEAVKRVQDGQIGDVVSGVFLRYEPMYLTGWYDIPNELKPDDVEYQLRKWLSFRWTSGDQFVEQYVHNLDMALWAMGELPEMAIGSGGRQTNITYPEMGDRYSNCHVQFDFASGKTLTASCRQENGSSPYAPFTVYGTKGVLNMSFGKQKITGEKPWESDYQKKPELICEHEALFDAVRNGKDFNTMKTCADSCFAAILGREAAYSSKRLKWKWLAEKSKQCYMPENLTLKGKLPVEKIPCPADYDIINGKMKA